jgi:hypothetical protein
VHDARNPPLQAGGMADRQWEAAIAACHVPGLLRRVSWQRLLPFLAVAPNVANRRIEGQIWLGCGLMIHIFPTVARPPSRFASKDINLFKNVDPTCPTRGASRPTAVAAVIRGTSDVRDRCSDRQILTRIGTAVSAPLPLFVLGIAWVEFRVSTDTDPGDNCGRSLHKRYAGR